MIDRMHDHLLHGATVILSVSAYLIDPRLMALVGCGVGAGVDWMLRARIYDAIPVAERKRPPAAERGSRTSWSIASFLVGLLFVVPADRFVHLTFPDMATSLIGPIGLFAVLAAIPLVELVRGVLRALSGNPQPFADLIINVARLFGGRRGGGGGS